MIVKENTLNVSWTQPEYKNGADLRYEILWERVGSNEGYQHRNVTRSPHIIKDLSKFNLVIFVLLYTANGTKCHRTPFM